MAVHDAMKKHYEHQVRRNLVTQSRAEQWLAELPPEGQAAIEEAIGMKATI